LNCRHFVESLMDFDEGIDLAFDVDFVGNEFAMDEAYDDYFNVGNAFFNDLLSSIEDLYGENNRTLVRSVMLPLIRNKLAEVGQWLRQSEQAGNERTNKDFVAYFGLTLEDMIDEDHMNTASIFDAKWHCYDDDENLDYVQLKIYRLFGQEEELNFRDAIMELKKGNLKEKIEYLLAKRIRVGEKIWEDLIWQGMLRRKWDAKDNRPW
jgi:hypothetical protein